jgi:hypothetical protein
MADIQPLPAIGFVGGVTASGQTAEFVLPSCGAVMALCNLTSISAAASVQVFLDILDAGGNWRTIVTLASQSAAGVQQAAAAVATSAGLTPTARLRWTVTGSSPAAYIAAFAAATS